MSISTYDQKMLATTSQLNSRVFELVTDIDQLGLNNPFEFTTDGYSAVILFMGQTVWSECDDSFYDDADREIVLSSVVWNRSMDILRSFSILLAHDNV